MDIVGGESKHLPGWFERGGGQIAIQECPWERRSLLLGASLGQCDHNFSDTKDKNLKGHGIFCYTVNTHRLFMQISLLYCSYW